jgi:Zn-dependent peptidase ImmA (M78 family)
MGVIGVRRRGGSPIKLNAASMSDYAESKGLITGNQLDIEGLIRLYPIEIRKEPLPQEISGKLWKQEEQWIISVNSTHPAARRRYTLAHEFGHYCLHRNNRPAFEDIAFFRKEANVSTIEYEANLFASELLMPERFVRAAISEDVLTLKALAERFDVSLLAMRRRLIDLGYNLIDDEE